MLGNPSQIKSGILEADNSRNTEHKPLFSGPKTVVKWSSFWLHNGCTIAPIDSEHRLWNREFCETVVLAKTGTGVRMSLCGSGKREAADFSGG
jgi:hypothetical protein